MLGFSRSFRSPPHVHAGVDSPPAGDAFLVDASVPPPPPFVAGHGGGPCILEAHADPDKLHRVGRPGAGHDVRLIDEAGPEVADGATGAAGRRSPGITTGCHLRRQAEREAEWFRPESLGPRHTGDFGRFDIGFLTLHDRRRDVVISGGFDIHPGDLEAAPSSQAEVAGAALVGLPSAASGETQVAFVVPRPGRATATVRWRT